MVEHWPQYYDLKMCLGPQFDGWISLPVVITLEAATFHSSYDLMVCVVVMFKSWTFFDNSILILHSFSDCFYWIIYALVSFFVK